MANKFLAPTLAKPAGAVALPKVALGRGKGLMDWIRLTNSSRDLAGTKGKLLEVTQADLEAHNKKKNAWMVINGNVYNAAPYMEYHPGGVEELMRGAGTDGTELFNQIHPWVNYESMLKACLVGKYVGSSRRPKKQVDNQKASTSSTSLSDLGIQCVFMEANKSVKLTINTHWNGMDAHHLTAEILDKSVLRMLFRPPHEKTVLLSWRLPCNAEGLQVSADKPDSGKITSKFKIAKEIGDKSWVELKPSVQISPSRAFRKCTIKSISSITHDTKLYDLELPTDCVRPVPIGHHVFIRLWNSSEVVLRPYTPVGASLCKSTENVSHFYLMIKLYSDGQMSKYLMQKKIGDIIEVSDSEGSFELENLNSKDTLIMLAAGTGFTPMVKLLSDSEGKSSLKKKFLMLFNKTEDDIPWREDLNKIERNNAIRIIHVLSKASSSWTGLRGRISQELLKDSIDFTKCQQPYFCICGPAPFTELAFEILVKMGYADDQVHAFQG